MWRDLGRVDLGTWDEYSSVENIPNKVGDTWEVSSGTCGDDARGEGSVVVWVERESEAHEDSWRSGGDRRCLIDPGFPSAQDTRGEHPSPFDPQREQLALQQTAWICTEVSEFVDFDTCFEAINPFYARERVAVAL